MDKNTERTLSTCLDILKGNEGIQGSIILSVVNNADGSQSVVCGSNIGERALEPAAQFVHESVMEATIRRVEIVMEEY